MVFAVHLHHKGTPLSFLLDVVEIAKSRTGEVLAKAFETMLQEFGISEKVCSTAESHRDNWKTYIIEILGVTADNAT